MSRRPFRPATTIGALGLLALVAAPASAQQKPRPRVDTTRVTPVDTTRSPLTDTGNVAPVTRDTTARDTAIGRNLIISPGKAFLRSILVPGWGQASAHSYWRGGIFFSIQTVSDYMLFKTIAKLNSAESWASLRRAFFSDSLRAVMAKDTVVAKKFATTAAFNLAIDSVGAVNDANALVKTRKKQREDWITLAIFWTLASGADALVNAQLSDFPTAVEIEPRAGGGMELRVALPARKPW